MDYLIIDGVLKAYKGKAKIMRLPPEVREIDMGAFEGCTELRRLTVPATVDAILMGALTGAANLEQLVIEGRKTFLDAYAFAGCHQLSDITIPDDADNLSTEAFDDTPWINAKENGWVHRGKLMRYKGNKREFTIPREATVIGEFAVWDNDNLEAVTIGPHVERIEHSTFYFCKNLQKVTFEGTPNIDSSAFDETPWLQNAPGGFFIWDKKLMRYVGSEEHVMVPDGIEEICNYAFDGNRTLKSVSLPASVRVIGFHAFRGCLSLWKLQLNDGMEVIKANAFTWCTSLIRVSIPSTVREIQFYAFSNCTNLEHMNLPERYVHIYPGALYRCDKLKKMQLSDSCSLTDEAFLRYKS